MATTTPTKASFCSSCGKQIGDSVAFCRYCGHGTAAATAAPATNRVTVKNVYAGKNLQIVGVIIFLFCAVGALISDHGAFMALGAAIGLGVYLAGRINHWYHAE